MSSSGFVGFIIWFLTGGVLLGSGCCTSSSYTSTSLKFDLGVTDTLTFDFGSAWAFTGLGSYVLIYSFLYLYFMYCMSLS